MYSAVALYFIDKLAFRVGNETDENSGDIVGCCSLRKEHISECLSPSSAIYSFILDDPFPLKHVYFSFLLSSF